MPHRVRASSETSVIDEINNNNRASNFEPAIRIILLHLNFGFLQYFPKECVFMQPAKQTESAYQLYNNNMCF